MFCSDDYLIALNKRFLKKNYFTDILSFSLGNSSEALEGEIYISVDRIKENSVKFHATYLEELVRVIIHGALHFCGYSDKTKVLRSRMFKTQEEYLKDWMVSRETIKL